MKTDKDLENLFKDRFKDFEAEPPLDGFRKIKKDTRKGFSKKTLLSSFILFTFFCLISISINEILPPNPSGNQSKADTSLQEITSHEEVKVKKSNSVKRV